MDEPLADVEAASGVFRGSQEHSGRVWRRYAATASACLRLYAITTPSQVWLGGTCPAPVCGTLPVMCNGDRIVLAVDKAKFPACAKRLRSACIGCLAVRGDGALHIDDYDYRVFELGVAAAD